ncbi:aspartate/glutamate racemase family protein [Anaerosolibacter sp.]|uniref:aspartate/glutamate racemase family protein n=1 Tax=Anaerosolibacter sp. TaxID=1872527 RepID=UPI0039F02C61
MKTIGILVGMGPRSTTPFLELVLDQCQRQYGAKYDIEFPHMIIYSLPTPFYLDRPVDHDKLKISIREGLKRLESCNVDFIAMPCNTAHNYFYELADEIEVPLLNIVEETVRDIGHNNKITLFATAPTMESRIYQDLFKQKGYTYMFDEKWQQDIDQIISLIKSGEDKETLKIKWEVLLRDVQLKGIDTIVIACTDINVILRENPYYHGVNFVDSAECLAKAVIREYLKK